MAGTARPGRVERGGRTIEWDDAAADYAANRAPFPDAIVDLLRPVGIGREGEHLVDVGTGVGTPALQFARRGTHVTGVEPAEAMLAFADRRAREEGLAFTPVVATAEATTLPDGCADSACSGQSWHWYDQPAALREFRRILRPGGRYAICSWDWIVGADPLVDATFEVLRRHNPDVAADNPLRVGEHFDSWLPVVEAGGLEVVGRLRVLLPAHYTPDTWRGRLRASTWGAATLAPDALAACDADLATVLADAPPRFDVPHHLEVLVAESPGPA